MGLSYNIYSVPKGEKPIEDVDEDSNDPFAPTNKVRDYYVFRGNEDLYPYLGIPLSTTDPEDKYERNYGWEGNWFHLKKEHFMKLWGAADEIAKLFKGGTMEPHEVVESREWFVLTDIVEGFSWMRILGAKEEKKEYEKLTLKDIEEWLEKYDFYIDGSC